jgi:hypothetical protein
VRRDMRERRFFLFFSFFNLDTADSSEAGCLPFQHARMGGVPGLTRSEWPWQLVCWNYDENGSDQSG